MKTKLFLLVLLMAPAFIYAQLSPSKGDYYTVEVTAQNMIYLDNDGADKYSISAGSVIKIRSVENDKIYFQVTKGNGELKEGMLYYINRVDFTEKYFNPKFYVRSGMLVTPFKYRPDKTKFYPGGNIAAAGSFTYNLFGLGLQPLMFAGITAISMADINQGQRTTETKWGFTVGGGLNFDVFDTFNVGFVTGWDFIDKDWESNGKVWLALSFNYKFLE
jgi:hypothetical protein